MPNRSIEAGRAFMRLFINDSAFKRGLDSAARRLRSFGRSAATIGRNIAVAGAGITAPFLASLRVFQQVGDRLDKTAARTGIAVEALSELGFAAEQSGSNLGDVERASRGLARSALNLERGLSTSVDAFGRLNLSAADLQGLSPEDQLTLVVDRLGQIESPGERAAVAMQVLGRAGTQLLPLAGNLSALRQEARDLGIVLDAETTGEAAAFTDALNRLFRVVQVLAVRVGAALSPALRAAAAALTRIAQSAGQWIQANTRLVRSVAALGVALLAVGAAVVAFGVASITVGAAVSGLAAIVGRLAAVAGAIVSPVGLAVAAVAALGFAILRYTTAGAAAVNFLREQFGSLASVIGDTFGGVVDALVAGDIQLAAEVAMAGLRVVFLRTSIFLRQTWLGLQSLLVNAWAGTVGTIIELSATLQSAWAKLTGALQSDWAKAQTDVTKGVLRAQKFIVERLTGEAFDISVELDQAQKQLDARRAQIRRETNADLASIEATRAGSQAVVFEDTQRRQAGLNAGLEEAKAAAADAAERLDALRNRAAEAAEAAEEPGDDGIQERIAAAVDALDAGFAGAANRLETFGGFSAAAVSRAAGSTLEQLSREQLRELRGLRKDAKQREGGIAVVA